MGMIALQWVGIFTAAFAYLWGLAEWIFKERKLPGLLAMLVFFPALIWLTLGTPWLFLRALPVMGLGLFVHRYRWRVLMEIRLLWFTTLSVLAIQAYYMLAGFLLGP